MKKFCIFIDESGNHTLSSLKQSPFYTVCGIVINQKKQNKLKINLEKLKQKHFGKKSYIIHGTELKRYFHNHPQKLTPFIKDLKKLLNNTSFFLLFATLDKNKAQKIGWNSKTNIHKKIYRTILDNLIKFLVAKNTNGNIIVEASTVEKDINLYQSFFHFLANGTKNPSIPSLIVKKYLTSLNFVTKLNNDPEEQLADLFSVCGKINLQIKQKHITKDSLHPLDGCLYKIMSKKLFKNQAQKTNKITLYKKVKSLNLLP